MNSFIQLFNERSFVRSFTHSFIANLP